MVTDGGYWAKVSLHAAAGGTLNELQGGDFGHGFVTAGVSAGVSPLIDTIGDGRANARPARIVVQALVGGAVSKGIGGDFGAGALMAAIGRVLNAESALARKNNQTDRRVIRRGLALGEESVTRYLFPELSEKKLSRITLEFSLDCESCGFTPYAQLNLPERLSGCGDLATCEGGSNIDLFVHELSHAALNLQRPSFGPLSASVLGFATGGMNAKAVGEYLPYQEYRTIADPSRLNSEKFADWQMWRYRDVRSGKK
jgi:hypothetical protein